MYLQRKPGVLQKKKQWKKRAPCSPFPSAVRRKLFLEASISFNGHNPRLHILFHSWFLFYALIHVLKVAAFCCSLYISFCVKCSTPLFFFSLQKYKKEFFVEVMLIKWKFIHPSFARHFLFLIAFFLSFSPLICFQVLLSTQLETCRISVHPVWVVRFNYIYRPSFIFLFRTLMFRVVELFSTIILFFLNVIVYSRKLRISR
jgi:hypothetical protein